MKFHNLIAKDSEMIQSESGNQAPSPSFSLPLLQTTNPGG
jgi:hypothetical protein